MTKSTTIRVHPYSYPKHVDTPLRSQHGLVALMREATEKLSPLAAVMVASNVWVYHI
jgi:hypothetical protein